MLFIIWNKGIDGDESNDDDDDDNYDDRGNDYGDDNNGPAGDNDDGNNVDDDNVKGHDDDDHCNEDGNDDDNSNAAGSDDDKANDYDDNNDDDGDADDDDDNVVAVPGTALYPLSHLHLATFRSKPPATANVAFSGNYELNMFHDIQNLNMSDTMDPLPEHYQVGDVIAVVSSRPTGRWCHGLTH